MKSVRYAVYLCIFLHFLRQCLRKPFLPPKKTSDGIDWNRPEIKKALEPLQAEAQMEIDRAILAEMVNQFHKGGRVILGNPEGILEPRPMTLEFSMRYVANHPVEYINLRTTVSRGELSPCPG